MNLNARNNKITTTDEIVTKIYYVVLNDRRLKLPELADMINILIDRVHYILHHVFGMKKAFCSMGVIFANSRLKTHSNDHISRAFRVRRVSSKFYNSRWNINNHYMPEMKQQSKQWVGKCAKKAETLRSAGDVGRITIHYWTNWRVLFQLNVHI